MRDVTGRGATAQTVPQRTDLGLHDFMGGNTFLTDIVDDFFPGEVNVQQLQAAEARARGSPRLSPGNRGWPRVQYGAYQVVVRLPRRMNSSSSAASLSVVSAVLL